MRQNLRCFARGYDGRFEAICIDLDISVEARSLAEAQRCLEEAIRSYVLAAIAEDKATARRLLTRQAPWHVRMSWIASFALHMLLHKPEAEQSMYAGYDMPCPA